MAIKELKKLFDEQCAIVSQSAESVDNQYFFMKVYLGMFKEYPNVITLESEGFYRNEEASEWDEEEVEDDADYNYSDDEKDNVYRFTNLFVARTMCNFANHFKDSAYIVRLNQYPVIIADKLIIFWSDYYREIYVLQDSEELRQDVIDCVADKGEDNMHRWFSYVTSTAQGFSETSLKCKKQDIDLSLNYNDDLPHEQIVEFLKSGKSGLMLLFGEPGTGKSSYIRHLMYELKGRHFMVMDASVFNYITDASFIDLLLQNKNAVIILEDCETMLTDRVTTGNAMLSTLLNLSDGIIGDGLNFKFICTFNAPIGKLDKALQRKGRMKVKYEFKKLTVEKTKALANKLNITIKEGEALTLADIFNYNVDNGKETDIKKIGFSK